MTQLLPFAPRPALGGGGVLAKQDVPDLLKPLSGMKAVQHPHRIRSMQVEVALEPFGPIGDGFHFPGRFHAPPMEFPQRGIGKGRGISQTGTVTQMRGPHLLALRLGCANRHQFDLRPRPTAEPHHAPIDTRHQAGRSHRRERRGLQEVVDLVLLALLLPGSQRLGVAP